MSSENDGNNLQPIPEHNPKKRMRGPGKKPIKLTHDPTYSAQYWRTKRSVQIHCENCGKLCARGKMYRHIQFPICQRYAKSPEEVQRIKDAHYAKVRSCDLPTDFSELD